MPCRQEYGLAGISLFLVGRFHPRFYQASRHDNTTRGTNIRHWTTTLIFDAQRQHETRYCPSPLSAAIEDLPLDEAMPSQCTDPPRQVAIHGWSAAAGPDNPMPAPAINTTLALPWPSVPRRPTSYVLLILGSRP